MKRYRLPMMKEAAVEGPEGGRPVPAAEFYLASDVDALVQILRGALADIATSDDMTLEMARAKAKRIYEETEGDRQA